MIERKELIRLINIAQNTHPRSLEKRMTADALISSTIYTCGRPCVKHGKYQLQKLWNQGFYVFHKNETGGVSR